MTVVILEDAAEDIELGRQFYDMSPWRIVTPCFPFVSLL